MTRESPEMVLRRPRDLSAVDAATMRRFLRFVATGVLNTAFGYGLYALLVLTGLHPQIALALQFAISIVWNYVVHARFVFGQDGFGKLPRYAGVYVLVYLVNAAALAALLSLDTGPLLAQLLILPFVVILTFLLLSRVFSKPRAGSGT